MARAFGLKLCLKSWYWNRAFVFDNLVKTENHDREEKCEVWWLVDGQQKPSRGAHKTRSGGVGSQIIIQRQPVFIGTKLCSALLVHRASCYLREFLEGSQFE